LYYKNPQINTLNLRSEDNNEWRFDYNYKEGKIQLRVGMNKILILLLFLTSCQNHLQGVNVKQSGTYIFAGICKDGILVFTDSRTVFQDENNKIRAHFDGVSKIYRYKKYVIAMAGDATYGKTYFRDLFNNYTKQQITPISVDSLLTSFFSYAKIRLLPEEFASLTNNQFLVSGYKEGIPYIMWYYQKKIRELTSIGDFKSNNKLDDNNREIKDFFQHCNIYGCQNMIASSLNHFIEKCNKDTVSVFGGKLTSVAIFRDSLVVIADQNNYSFNNNNEFIKAYFNNRIPIIYRSREDSIILRKAFLKQEEEF